MEDVAVDVNEQQIGNFIDKATDKLAIWLSSPEVYMQAAAIIAAFFLSYIVAAYIKKVFTDFTQPKSETKYQTYKSKLLPLGTFIFPILNIVALGLVIEFGNLSEKAWLIRASQALALTLLTSAILNKAIKNKTAAQAYKALLIPIVILYAMGWLEGTSAYLAQHTIKLGNINLAINDFIRVAIFGSFIVWAGRTLNRTVTNNIRNKDDLDIGTKEVIAKLFEVGMFVVVFVLLLQVMGINITALAVFGGALAVGLGFGLQSIASNFISGIIILLDRSVVVGDYVELEDGKQGSIRAMNMRSTTVETFDGKDVVVPNEKFITSSFVNWTHKNAKQRYSIELQVAYSTDLHKLFDTLRSVVSSHPQVISGDQATIEERPDAEIAGFGDSGVDILIEFWMEGIDDGKNRVGGDLLLMIWDVLQEQKVEIPYPQREVRILNPQD